MCLWYYLCYVCSCERSDWKVMRKSICTSIVSIYSVVTVFLCVFVCLAVRKHIAHTHTHTLTTFWLIVHLCLWGWGDHKVRERQVWCGEGFCSTSQQCPPALALISPRWKPFLWPEWHSLSPLHTRQRMHTYTQVHSKILRGRYAQAVYSCATQRENHTRSIHSSGLWCVFLFYDCVKWHSDS